MIPRELFEDRTQRWSLPPGTVQRILTVDNGTYLRGFTLPDGSHFAESEDGSRIDRLRPARNHPVTEVD
jgi:hypothetical protein